MTETDVTRPATDPEKLCQVADWLDLSDAVLLNVIKASGPEDNREGALKVVEGKEMQADLRRIAERLEALEEFYVQARYLAYAHDCDDCGVPDQLLDLVQTVEAAAERSA